MLKTLELVEGDCLQETFVSFQRLPESPTVSVLGSKYSPGMVPKKPPLFEQKVSGWISNRDLFTQKANLQRRGCHNPLRYEISAAPRVKLVMSS